MSIKLHKDYGLNPTIAVCIYCGEDKNEIALLGTGYKEKAPHRMVIDFKPCDKCKEQMDKGITIIEVESEGSTQPIRWCVITEDAAKRLFEGVPELDNILKHKTVRVEKDFISKVIIDE